jgi:hypothetical protein
LITVHTLVTSSVGAVEGDGRIVKLALLMLGRADEAAMSVKRSWIIRGAAGLCVGWSTAGRVGREWGTLVQVVV